MGNAASSVPPSEGYKSQVRWRPHSLLSSTGDSDCPCNFLFLGPTRTGKTTLLYSFFDECIACEPTIGYETLVKVIAVDDFDVKFQVWDVAGDFDYKELSKKELTAFDAIFLFVDQACFASEASDWTMFDDFQSKLFASSAVFYLVAIPPPIVAEDGSNVSHITEEVIPATMLQFMTTIEAKGVLRTGEHVRSVFLEVARHKLHAMVARSKESQAREDSRPLTKQEKIEQAAISSFLMDSMTPPKAAAEHAIEVRKTIPLVGNSEKNIAELLGDIDPNPTPYPKPENVDDSKFREKFNAVNNNAEDSCILS